MVKHHSRSTKTKCHACSHYFFFSTLHVFPGYGSISSLFQRLPFWIVAEITNNLSSGGSIFWLNTQSCVLCTCVCAQDGECGLWIVSCVCVVCVLCVCVCVCVRACVCVCVCVLCVYVCVLCM